MRNFLASTQPLNHIKQAEHWHMQAGNLAREKARNSANQTQIGQLSQHKSQNALYLTGSLISPRTTKLPAKWCPFTASLTHVKSYKLIFTSSRPSHKQRLQLMISLGTAAISRHHFLIRLLFTFIKRSVLFR